MKKRKQIQSQLYIYPPEVRKTIFRFNGFFFILLLVFSIILILISNILSSTLGRKPMDENEIFTEYVTASLPANADDLFSEYIDSPMEEQFNSSTLTSFYFSTENYPAEEGLISYLETALTNYTENSKYISGAVVYASTTNAYVTSSNFSTGQNTETKNFLEDMIYEYNSNTLNRTQISGRKSNTFLFQYKNQLVVSKDLTTLAGTPHAIMFVFLDMDALGSSIYSSITSVPYKVSIFDSYNNMLYSNSVQNETKVIDYLSRLSVSKSPFERAGNLNFIYCSSNTSRFQYVLEIHRDAVSRNPENPLLFYGIAMLTIVLLSLFMTVILFFFLGKPTARLFFAFSSQEMAASVLPSKTFRLLTQRIDDTLQENLTLRKIVAATSQEAISSLFSRLIAGQKIEEEETRITLENTDYGFHPNDIYIAGILYHSGQDFLSVENRYRILSLLTASFKDFKKKHDVNICAFLYDDRAIAIIASFVFGTSIAKGKTKINDLKEQINETLDYSNIHMLLAFGNMYTSILDLSFSYNEAFRGIHYMVEAVSVSNAAVITTNPALKAYKTVSDSFEETTDEMSTDTENNEISSQDFLELIYRRAEQIAKLIWDEKEEQVQSLIERTIDDIIKSGILADQTNNCKRLVSAVTSHMLSYPFVSDTHLSDVYNQLSLNLKEDNFSSEDLKENVQEALLILCSDFSEALKKQRNPYIMAAQEYIRQHYGSPELTLEEIAENLKIAPNYLSTIFSKNLGKRLFEYINEYRLDKSIELLLNTAKSINDIGEESGFGSSRNYIRIFKKYKGLPPGAYRKQHQEQQTHTDSEKV